MITERKFMHFENIFSYTARRITKVAWQTKKFNYFVNQILNDACYTSFSFFTVNFTLILVVGRTQKSQRIKYCLVTNCCMTFLRQIIKINMQAFTFRAFNLLC